MNLLKFCGLSVACSLFLFSCDSTPEFSDDVAPDMQFPPEMGGGNLSDDGDAPEFDTVIAEYDGQKADDADMDIVGTDENFYWEANTFDNKIIIVYSETAAPQVTVSNDAILYHTDGSYVTIDMLTNSVKGVEIIASGTSNDGQLKIYGEKKFKLTLNGLKLTCTKSSAINNQCKKRVFVHLEDGTENYLIDESKYSDEPYYIDETLKDDEDRKGCFFSEGNMIFSGTGVLVVKGKKKHGIATDGYFYMRHGVTIAVIEAAKNAIHVKGDEDDAIGIRIDGGLVYAHTSATAGKGMKTDLNVDILGGKLMLNTSGGSEYEEDENDTSSPAGIKADGNMVLTAGTLILKSTGEGGKGLNIDGNLQIDGGSMTISTTGGRYVYDEALDLTSSPKGVKADGNFTINGGEVNVYVGGASDGSEGLESKSAFTINGGKVYVYAYDDAINAASDITINGGDVYAYSVTNDAMDSNGTLNLNGGQAVAIGGNVPEGGFDCDRSEWFKVTGGTFLGLGGASATPSSQSTQRVVVYNGLRMEKDAELSIANSSGTAILTYKLPLSMNDASMFFSSADLVKGDYSVSVGDSSVGSFTSNNIITTVGSSMGGGQGGPGGPGGGGPGRPW